MVVTVPANAFEEGNTAHLKHGVWSDRKIDPVALEFAEGLVEERPELLRFPASVWAWARAEARCLLLQEYFAEHRLVDEDGDVVPVTRFVHQFEKLAMQMREKLGLDPKSEADLITSRAEATRHSFDINALIDAGAEALESRG